MPLQTIRDYAGAIILEVDALNQPPPPPPPSEITIGPGDNLLDAIAQSDGTKAFKVDPEFRQDCGYATLAKPVRLVSGNENLPPPGQRISGTGVKAPELLGMFTFTAPDVQAVGIKFRNISGGDTIWQSGERPLLDRCIVSGRDTEFAKRGVMANCKDSRIVDSHIAGFWNSNDTQAVGCNAWTKNLRIQNCYLEATGENFMSGGDDGPSADSIPDGILIEDCDLVKPWSWFGDGTKGIKNGFELKNAKNVIFRRSRIRNVWADAQTGYAIVLTVRNQSGKNPWATIENVLVEDIEIENCGAGVSVLGRDYLQTSQIMSNVVIRNVRVKNMSMEFRELGRDASGRALTISGGPINLKVDGLKALEGAGYVNSALGFDQYPLLAQGLELRNCELDEGYYGIVGNAPGSIGLQQLQGHAPGVVWENMIIRRGGYRDFLTYPAGTTILPKMGSVARYAPPL